MAGILLQMELAALPGHAREHRFPSGLEAFMGIAHDQLDTAQAAVLSSKVSDLNGTYLRSKALLCGTRKADSNDKV